MITRTRGFMPAVGWVPVVMIGVLLGAAIPVLDPALSLPAMLLYLVAVALGLSFMVSGPAGCVGAIALLVILGGQVLTAEVGSVDLQVGDAFFAALVLWVIARETPQMHQRKISGPETVHIPTAGIFVFMCYVGLTLVKVAVVDPGQLETSVVSWLRLIQTTSLIWLTATAIRTTLDVRRVIKVVALSGTAVVLMALTQAAQAGTHAILRDRFGGPLNENSLGLVSGLLLLLSFSAGVRWRSRLRLTLGSLGLVGLVLSKSVAATVATAVVLGIAYGMRRRQPEAGIDRLVRVGFAMGIGLFVVVALIAAARPEVLPTSPEFRLSSATHRTVVAAAGWRIFAQEPLTGVGWQRSSSPAVIGAGEIAAALRDRFPGVNPNFFPDVAPTSVHNAYVQVLAELGLIGFTLFALAIGRSGLAIRRLVQRVSTDQPLAPEVQFMALGLLLILIWWNDNPIFGGQVETVLAAIFLGMLVFVGRNAGGAKQYPSRFVPTRLAT